eukprot:scaffold51535_cov63-Phaeocystis_antarctica.AAC.3
MGVAQDACKMRIFLSSSLPIELQQITPSMSRKMMRRGSGASAIPATAPSERGPYDAICCYPACRVAQVFSAACATAFLSVSSGADTGRHYERCH